jgi:hypothetical protein
MRRPMLEVGEREDEEDEGGFPSDFDDDGAHESVGDLLY